MAIPLIIGGALGAAGLYKAGKAIYDNSKADDVNSSAEEIVNEAEKNLDLARKSCEDSLQNLGQMKVETITTQIQRFVTEFEKIQNIEFDISSSTDGLLPQETATLMLEELSKHVSFITTSGLGIGGGAIGGALTAYGAYSGVMALGTAGTGAAISSLSGAAATNATLAWLGGGTLASGGGGVVMGALALKSLVAGPAVLIAGWYMGSKAKTNFNNAHSNKAEAKKFAEDMSTAIALTNGIESTAKLASDILSTLRAKSRRSLIQLAKVVKEEGTDYSLYTDSAKEIVFKNFKLTQLIKVIIETPILDQKGDIVGDSESNLLHVQQDIKQLVD